MKQMIRASLLAAGLLASYGLANAAPPTYYVNREVGSYLYALSWDFNGGWRRYTTVSVWDNYDYKGNYVDSGFWIEEWGYSDVLGHVKDRRWRDNL